MSHIITEYDNIIIGAGPAGIQLGYFFQKHNIKYLIIEKSDICASFFNKYPHSKQLISLNKPFTGKDHPDFNLRHDWNSLLNDESFLFKNYSEELYPNSNALCTYLNDFANNNKLNIKYSTTVSQINKLTKNKNYEVVINGDDNNNIKYHCANLIMATGLSMPILPNIEFKHSDNTETGTNKIKHYGDYPSGYFKDKSILDTYKAKKVLIIGGGNASYELANILQSYCSNIIIMGSKKDLSIVSHYTGDIRTIYLPFLDTFYLKSMNGIDTLNKNLKLTIIQNKDKNDINYEKYTMLVRDNNSQANNIYNDTKDLEYYDEIIYCTGWKFNKSLFNFELSTTVNNKFPQIDYNYQSVDNINLYFIGSLMHSHDFKKSSGGFIHGFRYLIKLFTQVNFNIPFTIHKFKFDGTLNCYTNLADNMFNRINFGSSIYQMYGILKDIYYFNKETNEIIYYESITNNIFEYVTNNKVEKYNTLELVYGDKIYDIRELGNFNQYNPVFLHPEIVIYEQSSMNANKNGILSYDKIDKIIFEENLIADFKSVSFYDKIKRSLKYCNLII